jgi:hypothetical protein
MDEHLLQKGLASEEPNKSGGRAENLFRFVIKVLLVECALSVAVTSKWQVSGESFMSLIERKKVRCPLCTP